MGIDSDQSKMNPLGLNLGDNALMQLAAGFAGLESVTMQSLGKVRESHEPRMVEEQVRQAQEEARVAVANLTNTPATRFMLTGDLLTNGMFTHCGGDAQIMACGPKPSNENGKNFFATIFTPLLSSLGEHRKAEPIKQALHNYTGIRR